MKNLIVTGLVIAITPVLVVLLFVWMPGENVSIKVDSFDVCVSRGYPVIESYPRQCKTPEGVVFIEEVDIEFEAERIYVSKDKQQCETIRFLCENGKKPFFDDGGCGCESVIEGRKYCDAESREGDFCADYFSPVCGWFGENIQCIRYPCAETYSNACFACHDEKVAYFTQGECPA